VCIRKLSNRKLSNRNIGTICQKKRLVHPILEDVFRLVFAQTLPVLYIQTHQNNCGRREANPLRVPGALLLGPTCEGTVWRLFHKAHLFRQSKHSPCLYRRSQLSTSKQRLQESTLLFLYAKVYARVSNTANDASPMIAVASKRDRATGAGARDKEESKKGFLANLRQGIIYGRSECQ
jgi:hypothetical protein